MQFSQTLIDDCSFYDCLLDSIHLVKLKNNQTIKCFFALLKLDVGATNVSHIFRQIYGNYIFYGSNSDAKLPFS